MAPVADTNEIIKTKKFYISISKVLAQSDFSHGIYPIELTCQANATSSTSVIEYAYTSDPPRLGPETPNTIGPL